MHLHMLLTPRCRHQLLYSKEALPFGTHHVVLKISFECEDNHASALSVSSCLPESSDQSQRAPRRTETTPLAFQSFFSHRVSVTFFLRARARATNILHTRIQFKRFRERRPELRLLGTAGQDTIGTAVFILYAHFIEPSFAPCYRPQAYSQVGLRV
jgi:hypothetical protein